MELPVCTPEWLCGGIVLLLLLLLSLFLKNGSCVQLNVSLLPTKVVLYYNDSKSSPSLETLWLNPPPVASLSSTTPAFHEFFLNKKNPNETQSSAARSSSCKLLIWAVES